MKSHCRLTSIGILVVFLMTGCTPGTGTLPAQDKGSQIQANLGKLDPGDRTLAQAQKYCAVEPESRLGEMGKPYKILIKDQPVFLCCKGCEKEALAHPDKTLAKVKELKAKEDPAKP
jgi:hypothetical protein